MSHINDSKGGKMRSKGETRKDQKQKRRKESQKNVFGHSSNGSKTLATKRHKQKQKRQKRHQKKEKGGLFNALR